MYMQIYVSNLNFYDLHECGCIRSTDYAVTSVRDRYFQICAVHYNGGGNCSYGSCAAAGVLSLSGEFIWIRKL